MESLSGSTLQIPARLHKDGNDFDSDSDGVMVSAPPSPNSDMYIHDSEGDDAPKQFKILVEQNENLTPVFDHQQIGGQIIEQHLTRVFSEHQQIGSQIVVQNKNPIPVFNEQQQMGKVTCLNTFENKDNEQNEEQENGKIYANSNYPAQAEMLQMKIPEDRYDPEIASPSIMPDDQSNIQQPSNPIIIPEITVENPPEKYKKIKIIMKRIAKVLCCPCVCVGITGMKSYKNVIVGYEESIKWAKS
jgi:hypothetical protein